MPTLPPLVTISSEAPLDEATLNGFKVPVPWMLKFTVEDVAFTPLTVRLSNKSPVLRVVGDVKTATLPLVPPEIPPLGVVVAITLPFWSTAKKVEVKAFPKVN